MAGEKEWYVEADKMIKWLIRHFFLRSAQAVNHGK